MFLLKDKADTVSTFLFKAESERLHLSLSVEIFDRLVPLHEVASPVEHMEANESQIEHSVLVREDMRVDTCAAVAYKLIDTAPNQQSGVQYVNWDEDCADLDFRLGSVVPSGESKHYGEADEDLPLGDGVQDESEAQATVCESVCCLG